MNIEQIKQIAKGSGAIELNFGLQNDLATKYQMQPDQLQAFANAIIKAYVAEQKPVAWKYKTNKVHTWITEVIPPDDAYDEETLTPLYDLTTKEI